MSIAFSVFLVDVGKEIVYTNHKKVREEKKDENVKIEDEEVEEIGRPEDLIGLVDGDATEANAEDLDFNF